MAEEVAEEAAAAMAQPTTTTPLGCEDVSTHRSRVCGSCAYLAVAADGSCGFAQDAKWEAYLRGSRWRVCGVLIDDHNHDLMRPQGRTMWTTPLWSPPRF